MLESPAIRVLSLAARRALNRIEIELAHHGGNDNGKLPITYADFERYGLHPNAIAPAIRELAALGFIEVTRKGYGGAAEVRAPSLYRITFRPAWNATSRDGMEPTNICGSRQSSRRRLSRNQPAGASIFETLRGPKGEVSIQNAILTFREISPSENEGETTNHRPHIPRVQAHPQKVRVLSKVSGAMQRLGEAHISRAP
jgi:hypothetical protein